MSTVESIARPRRNGERRRAPTASISKESPAITGVVDRKSGSAGMPRPTSYAVFCLKKKMPPVTFVYANFFKNSCDINRHVLFSNSRCKSQIITPTTSELLIAHVNLPRNLLIRTAPRNPKTIIFLTRRPPPRSTLFPYTTLFRSKATTQWRKTESANGVHLEGVASDNRSSGNGNKTTNLTSKEAKMGKVMRHTLGASLNIRHNLSSSKGPKPLQLKLLTTYIPKTSAFTLAFSTSQRLRTTRASARTFFTFRHYITPSARNF